MQPLRTNPGLRRLGLKAHRLRVQELPRRDARRLPRDCESRVPPLGPLRVHCEEIPHPQRPFQPPDAERQTRLRIRKLPMSPTSLLLVKRMQPVLTASRHLKVAGIKALEILHRYRPKILLSDCRQLLPRR
jgi:hypothetical protein